jgi:hypothetical protein
MLCLKTAIRSTKNLLPVLGLLMCLPTARGDNQTRQWSWSTLKQEGALLSGTVVGPDGTSQVEQLRLMRSDNYSDNLTFLTCSLPPGGSRSFLLTGFIRGEGVETAGTLEMATRLSDGRTVRQRAIEKNGKLLRLKGQEAWKQFMLPFNSGGGTVRPDAITVRLDLPGRGTVYLGPLQLVEYTVPAQNPPASSASRSTVSLLSYGLMVAGFALLLGLLYYRKRHAPQPAEEEENEAEEQETGKASKVEDEWEGPGS